MPDTGTLPGITFDPALGTSGDQNNDGEVKIFDAIIALQIIVELIEPTPEQLY